MFGSGVSTAAQLMVKVGADVQDAQQKLNGLSSSLQGMGTSAMKAGGMMSMATAPIALMGIKALDTAGEFEQAMNILSVAAKSSQTSLDDLSSAALAVGADTELVGITASQAGESMTMMYKAGLTTSQVFGDMQGYLEGTTSLSGALRSAIDLAASSELDLAQATDVVAVAMSTFGLSASDAGAIADNLVKTADAGVASVSGLAESLRNVGPIANSMGIGLETVTQALSLMASRGIEGAEAGTQLKSMLLNMQRQTSDVVGTWKSLGVSIYDTTGTMKALPTIMGELEDAMAGMTMEQRNQTIQTLAGTYGLNAMNTLLAEGKEGWAAMGASIEGAAGIQENAEARTKGWKAALETLGGVVESIQIKALTPFLENVLTPMVRKLGDLLGGVMALDPKIVNMGIIFAALAVAAGPVLLMVGALSMGLGVLLSPIGLVIAGIVALGVALATNFGGIRDVLQPVVDAVVAFGSYIMAVVQDGDLLNDWLTNLPTFLQPVALAVGQTVDWLARFFEVIVNGLGDGWSMTEWIEVLLSKFPIVGQVIADVLPIIAQLGSLFSSVFVQMVEIVQTVFGFIITSVQENAAAIQSNLQAAWDSLTALVNGALTAISDIIQGLLGAVKTFLDAHGEDIKKTLGDAWVRISAIIATVMEILNATIVPVFQGIAQFISEHGAEIQTILSAAWTIVKNIIDGALTLIEGIVNTAMAILKGDWEGAWEIVKDTAERLWENIKEIVNAATTALVTAVGVSLVAIYDWFVEKFEAVKAYLNGIDLGAVGAAIIQGLIDGVKSMAGALISAAQGVVQSAIDAAKALLKIKSPSRVFREIGQNTIEGFILGVLDMTTEISEAINNAFTGPVRQAVETLGVIADAMNRVMEAMQTLALYGGVQDLPNKLNKLIDDIKLVVIQLQRLAEFFAVDNSPIWSAKAVLDPLAQIFNNLGQVIDAFAQIADLEVLDSDIEAFVAQLKQFIPKLVNGIVDAAAQINLAGLPAAIIFAQAAGAILSVLDGVVDALTAAMSFEPPKTDNTDAFIQAIRFFVARLQTMASQMGWKAFDEAIKFAEAAGRIGAQMKTALEGMVTAMGYIAPEIDNTDAFFQAIRFFVARLQTMASQMGWKVFDDAIKFAEAAGKVTEGLKDGVAFLATLVDYVGPTIDDMDRFMWDFQFLFEKMGRWVVFVIAPLLISIGDDAVTFITDMMNTMGEALGVLEGLVEYISPAAGAIEAFTSDLVELITRFADWVSTSPAIWAFKGIPVELMTVFQEALSAIGTAVGVLNSLVEYVSPGEVAINNFIADMGLLIAGFVAWVMQSRSGPWLIMDVPEEMMTAFSSAMAAMESAINVLVGLVNYVSPGAIAIASFTNDYQALFFAFATWARTNFADIALDVVEEVGRVAGVVFDGLGSAVETLQNMTYYVGPTANNIDRFMDDVEQVMIRLRDWALANFTTTSLTFLAAFGTTAQTVFTAIGSALSVMQGIANYTVTGSQFDLGLQRFNANLIRMLQSWETWVLNVLSPQATSLTDEFASQMQTIVNTLRSALELLMDLDQANLPTADELLAFLNAVSALFTGVIATFDVVLTQIGSMVIGLGNQIRSVLQFVEDTIEDFGVNMQDQILAVFLSLGDLMWNRGDYIAGMFMSGMLRGMQNVNSINAITNAMYDLANQMRDVLMAAWGIHSPSRVAEKIGQYFVLGLQKGLEDLYGLPGMVQDALDMQVNGSNILFETTPQRAYLTVLFEGAWQAGMTPAEEQRITKSMVQELRRQGMYVLAN